MATKKPTIKKSPKPKMYWQFDIVKWDATGNKILEKHKMTVQRQTKYDAITLVRKKYPVSKGYYEELNDSWSK